MTCRLETRVVAGITLVAAVGCGGTPVTPPPPPPPSCTAAAPVNLAPGAFSIIDPQTSNGCVTFGSQTSAESEYLVVAVATNGVTSPSGVSGTYRLGSATAATASAITPSAASTVRSPSVAEEFHRMLRERERALSLTLEPGGAPAPSAAAAAIPPVVGSQRTFKVCATLLCTSFSDVQATAMYVGTKGAVYLDNTVPANGYNALDITNLGHTFDDYHYPLDVAAFGAESDIDANNVVIILLTDAVNALTPDCTNGRILGFFFGGDLLPTSLGSNAGEVFYAMVPSPATSGCPAISQSRALDLVKGTLIHEFQHMISYNQHVLVRGGASEVTWLNEALSHFAEELGGRFIPDGECPNSPSCRSLYVSGNFFNAYDYLENTEANYLISPESSTGTLEERGAEWMFLRWIVDQFASPADPVKGAAVTQALVKTSSVGNVNVQNVTGESFATLVTQWHLANYLDDLPGFTPASNRLQYSSWGFRGVFAANAPPNGTIFELPFPMVPEVITAGVTYSRSGTLRGGSGRTWRVLLPAGAADLTLQLRKDVQGTALDAALAARIGVARIQ